MHTCDRGQSGFSHTEHADGKSMNAVNDIALLLLLLSLLFIVIIITITYCYY